MTENQTFMAVAFLAVSTFALLVVVLLLGRRQRSEGRLRELGKPTGDGPEPASQFTRTTLPKLGAPLMPKKEEERTRLKTRLVHAGLYSRHAVFIFLGVKMLMMITPILAGLLAGAIGMMSFTHALLIGLFGGAVGMVLPGLWLGYRKSKRQISIRRALPDALDVMVICMEGGLSLTASLHRVGRELRTAHPLLASELSIIEREMQMGRSTGEALRQFADRCDLEEARSLATVIIQAERYGAGMVKSLRVHADGLRLRRQQRAEEQAQKAAVKILFPTLLCIFPAIFLVFLGPAVIQIMDLFRQLR